MRFFSIVIFVLVCIPLRGFALDVTTYDAQEIDLSTSQAAIYSHTPILFGLSCKSGMVSALENKKSIKIGDLIETGKISFRVGVIEVTQYNEDAEWKNETIAKKGDTACTIAKDKESLPYDDDCKATWVHVPNCIILH